MTKIVFLMLFSSLSFTTMAQKSLADSSIAANEDSLRMANLEAKLYYPILEAGTFSGVIPVKNPDESPIQI